MRTILVLAFIVTACAQGWSKKDTALELAYIAAAAGDETQTQWITYHCAETNPVIGPCGQGRVGGYFFVTDVLHLAISLGLPPKMRTVWQSVTVGVEASTVWKNYGDGVTFWP